MDTPANQPTFKIGLFLLEGFNSLAMHAFIDPFRCTNYLCGARLYEWVFLGVDSSTVVASNGVTIGDLVPITDVPADLDLLVINASWSVERFNQPRLLSWLRTQAKKGVTLCGLDTGAFVLGFAGLLKHRKAAVHYEHIAAFRETFPDTRMDEDLFVIDGDRLTCCGGGAASDLALEVLRLQQGIDIANAVGRYIFHERLRAGREGQLPARNEPIGSSVPAKLREAIVLMERNLEHLLAIGEVARQVDLSQRQMERLFKTHTGVSPVRYYLDVRLDRARGLVTQTELPITTIAVACGFTSGARFTRAYKERFGLAPSRDRIEGRVPFQFRSFPSHAGL